MHRLRWQLAATLQVVSSNSLQPITLHWAAHQCTEVERRQVRAVGCFAVTWLQCSLPQLLLDPTQPDGFFSAGCRRRLHCRRYCSLTARLPHPGAHKPKQLCNAMKCAETAWRWTGSAVRQGAVCSPVCWQQTSLLRCHHVTVFLFAGYFTCCIGVGLFTARWRFTLSCIWLRIFPTLCVTLLKPRQGHKSSQDPCLSKPIWSSPTHWVFHSVFKATSKVTCDQGRNTCAETKLCADKDHRSHGTCSSSTSAFCAHIIAQECTQPAHNYTLQSLRGTSACERSPSFRSR